MLVRVAKYSLPHHQRKAEKQNRRRSFVAREKSAEHAGGYSTDCFAEYKELRERNAGLRLQISL